jgi:CPA2 family monovalent cation:H+ antiporter-2
MTGTTGLELTLVLLLAAVLGVAIFRLLHLPPLLGYLAVGILIGPYSLGLVPDTPQARYLAEFGVVFLMFSIGLEFNLAKLRAMRQLVFGLGLAQVALTMLIAMVALLFAAWALADVLNGLFNIGWAGAFALGGALAMSSTAIVVKLLAERLELDTPHGRQIMGILLFQDLAVVPLLVITPALARSPDNVGWVLALASMKAVFVLLVLLVFGQRLMRWWFHIVAKRRSHELFMLNLLLMTLGLAWITEHAGLSLALGAFVAGMLISETEYRHQVEEDIKPFRDVLLGLFFITLGMLLNIRIVAEHFLLVLLLLCLPVLLKLGLIALLARWFGATPGTALRSGLALCTAGEFGFVVLSQAGGLHLVNEVLMQVILASMLLSMLIAPFLIQYSDRIVMRFTSSEWMLASLNLTKLAAKSMSTDRHVIICGFGRSGQNLARLLEAEDIGYVALDLDPERVREAAAAGDSVVYGDAARRESLIAAGIHRAQALVITYAETASALKVLRHAHDIAPALPVIVRTHDDADLDKLREAGAAEVVPEVIEGSLMLGTHALVLLGVPLSRVVKRVRAVRDERYASLRGFFHGAGDEEMDSNRAQIRLHSIVLLPGAQSIGQALGDLGLNLIGVEVMAVRRREIKGAAPAPELILETNDIVVVRGVPEAIALAEERLLAR